MEIGTAKPVSRRSALGGMGAAMALPLVDSAVQVPATRMDGKVAIVTGSGRNLGRAGVLELARRGADVVVNARTNRQEAESVAREAESLGVRALALLATTGPDALSGAALTAAGPLPSQPQTTSAVDTATRIENALIRALL